MTGLNFAKNSILVSFTFLEARVRWLELLRLTEGGFAKACQRIDIVEFAADMS